MRYTHILLASAALMAVCHSSAQAITVDPSEAPNACVPPAGNIYDAQSCPTRFRCHRSDRVTGNIIAGSQTPVSHWTDGGDNCAGSQPIPVETTIKDETTFEIEVTLGGEISFLEETVKLKAETKVKHGRTATFEKKVTDTIGAHESVTYTWFVIEETDRKAEVSSTYTCGVRASRIVYFDPFALPCRIVDVENGWVSYSGGAPVLSYIVLNQSVVPGATEKTTAFPCPE